MTSKSIGIVLTALLVAGVAITTLLILSSDEDAAAVGAGAPDVRIPETSSVPDALPPPASLPRTDVGAVERAIEEPSASSPPDAAGRVEVSVTVVVSGGGGESSATPSGSIRVKQTSSLGSSARLIDVRSGRFTVRAPLDAHFAFEHVFLDGWAATIDGDFAVPATRALALDATWLPRLKLHVRGVESPRELENVFVCAARTPGPLRGLPPPISDREVVAEGRSPLSLIYLPTPQPNGIVDLFVFAPRHAWTHVAVDVTVGGERVIALDPACGLGVWIAGDPVPKHLRVVVERVGDPVPVAVLTDPTIESVYFEDIPSGWYHVTGTVDFDTAGSFVAAEDTVEVKPGERGYAHLAFFSQRSRRGFDDEHVSCTGVVAIPLAWRTSEASLDFRGKARRETVLARGDAVSADSALPSWTIELVPGDFLVTLRRFGWWSFEPLPSPNGAPTRIEVPPPGSVRVRVVDDATGVDVTKDVTLAWRAAPPIDARHPQAFADAIPRVPAKRGETGDGRFAFEAPTGTLDVAIDGADIRPLRARIAIQLGANDVELRVQKSCGILLTASDGATPILPGELWSAEVTAIQSNGEVLAREMPGRALVIKVSEPGQYQIVLPKIGGYAAAPAQMVQVMAGMMQTVDVRLARE